VLIAAAVSVSVARVLAAVRISAIVLALLIISP
jgi:hypothetical protein